jgi:outer membrane protein assembly factor BamB
MAWEVVEDWKGLGGGQFVEPTSGGFLMRFSTGDLSAGSGVAYLARGSSATQWKRVFRDENVFGVRKICVVGELCICVVSPKGADFDRVIGLRIDGGEVAWETELEVTVISGGVAVSNHEVFVCGRTVDFERKVFRLDAYSGMVELEYNAPSGRAFYKTGGNFIVRDPRTGLYSGPIDSENWEHVVKSYVERMAVTEKHYYYAGINVGNLAELVWCRSDSHEVLASMRVEEEILNRRLVPMNNPSRIAVYDYNEPTVEVFDFRTSSVIWRGVEARNAKVRYVADTDAGLVVCVRGTETRLDTFEVDTSEVLDSLVADQVSYRTVFWKREYLIASGVEGTTLYQWT